MTATVLSLSFLVVFCTALLYGNEPAAETNDLLRQARLLFYRSVEDEAYISKAEAAFRRLMAQDSRLEGRATTYLGALMAIKGKHAFWPHDKWDLANAGIQLMDKGIALAPTDVEALFIHGSTCYYLPFFFRRADDARQKFHRIVQLLPGQQQHYDTALLHNVIEFIETNGDLDETERAQLRDLQQKLAVRKAG